MRRIAELDSVRGLAALVIVVHHVWMPWCGFLSTAVDLFFVLSGYLITTIILEQHAQPGFLTVFYARRSLRIWPAYYLALLGLVVAHEFLPGTDSLAALPYYLTYTQRISAYWFGADPAFPEAFGHTWSLAVEEQFYLVWPLLVAWSGRRAVVPAAAAMIVAAFAARSAGFETWILLTRCDGLALGACLAWLLRRDRAEHIGMWAFAAVVGLALTYLAAAALLPLFAAGSPLLGPARALSHVAPRMLAINVLYFGVVGCLVRCAGRACLAPLRLRGLCWLGQRSYGIYLYHYVILYFVILGGAWARLGALPAGLATLAASLLLAALSWHFVERPLLSLKERFGYGAEAPRAWALSKRRESLRYEG